MENAKPRLSPSPRVYLLLALVAVCSLAILWSSSHFGRTENQPLAAEQTAVAPIWPLPSALQISAGPRAIFPYSVIAGGAETPQELQRAVAIDPVVAQHYSDFNLANVRRVTLSAPQMMYVSYRIGNNVYWTKHQLALPKGETVLTDGHSMARTRCGNRISAMPIRPNSPAEPAAEDFNAPVIPPSTSTPYLAAYSAPIPAFGAGPANQPGGAGGAPFVPAAPFFPVPGGGGVNGNNKSSTPPPGGGGVTPPGGGGVTPPGGGGGTPVGVSEPGTIALLLAGLCGVVFLTRRTKKAC